MKILPALPCKWLCILCIACMIHTTVSAQTDIDGIMMEKNNFCIGPMYGKSSWTNYWEGTFKRDNANLGKVSAEMFSVMGNYGVSDKLNVMFGLPYIKTKASQGTLHGMQGLQDLSVWVKWMPVDTKIGKGSFSAYAMGGVSVPVSNYVADFLPLSIGLRSKTLSIRAMADYQLGHWSTTVSGTYVARANIKIDRNSYYTTEMHMTNEVEMPDASSFNIRTGYRSSKLIAELVFNRWITLGGFDITKNNMPFPSNRMNATSIGGNLKYNIKAVDGLSLVANGEYVLDGRNVGQSTVINGGVFYIIDFSKKHKSKAAATNSTNNTKQ